MKTKTERMQKLWSKYKYAILVAVLGVGILLWGRVAPEEGKEPEPLPAERLAAGTLSLQTQLEEILKTVAGVGEVRVLLTLDSDGEQQLAQDTKLEYRGETAAPEDYSRNSETVLVDGDSGEEPVVVRQVYPMYRGALVVCQGGDRAEVQLAVIQAVSVLTGLSSDRIAVVKWQ